MITVGVDEVGRGCWAGPLVAAAVLLNHEIVGLKDSKKLSKFQRDALSETIHKQAVAIGIGWVWPEEIDARGLSWAVKDAMEQAVAGVREPFDELIVDGNINYFSDDPRAQAIIKADDTVPAVSAASIVAKVVRDNYMAEIAERYPFYGFEKHVGYGTAAHIKALLDYGVTELHRKSYKPIQKMLLP